MLKAMSTYVYVKERLHPGLLDGLVVTRLHGSGLGLEVGQEPDVHRLQ